MALYKCCIIIIIIININVQQSQNILQNYPKPFMRYLLARDRRTTLLARPVFIRTSNCRHRSMRSWRPVRSRVLSISRLINRLFTGYRNWEAGHRGSAVLNLQSLQRTGVWRRVSRKQTVELVTDVASSRLMARGETSPTRRTN